MLLEMTYRYCFKHGIHTYWQLSMVPAAADFIFNSVRYSLCPRIMYHHWSGTGVQVESSKYNSPITSRKIKIMFPCFDHISSSTDVSWCNVDRSVVPICVVRCLEIDLSTEKKSLSPDIMSSIPPHKTIYPADEPALRLMLPPSACFALPTLRLMSPPVVLPIDWASCDDANVSYVASCSLDLALALAVWLFDSSPDEVHQAVRHQ